MSLLLQGEFLNVFGDGPINVTPYQKQKLKKYLCFGMDHNSLN
jgi:hypothetical protein